MSFSRHPLELLAPAKTAEIAREAILHGADAVYIGGPSFGARASAGNSIAEIAELSRFAHRFGVRIFATLNTILHDNELEAARRQAVELWEAGVDALIVQDMGLLELDLPPIALHASTQCDIRTPEKARFLAAAGFSQLVLARELNLGEIRAIRAAVPDDVALEFFIHGALCVSYSGQCYLSHALTGRSANRGDCAQLCRLPYTLQDGQGQVIAFEKHLLSLKDNNQSANLAELAAAGISSFKIEGRYKDMSYVKNITAHYRQLLDTLLETHPELARASSGRSHFGFSPAPARSFNRGATDYFVNGRQQGIAAFDAPAHIGQALGRVTRLGADWFEIDSEEALANGDGLCWLHKREVVGVQANLARREGNHWRIVPSRPLSTLPGLQPNLVIHRSRDHVWEQTLQKKSAERRIAVDMRLADTAEGLELALSDEDGNAISARITIAKEAAQNPERAESQLRDGLAKLGTSIFSARKIEIATAQAWFVPASAINALRRDGIARLEEERLAKWVRPPRHPESLPAEPYPETSLSFLANVYNQAARRFYTRHGVTLIASAFEAHEEVGEVALMTTKHCLRFSFNMCPKQARQMGIKGRVSADPLTLVCGNEKLKLQFDCRRCIMHILGRAKRHTLQNPPPSLETRSSNGEEGR
ncbi:peptidase U32 family protein [Niveibacterium terrae]|uniref:peptidase U32 family protein n=1 Tax=Niveibacterium terrae TaxID=3373598 RepID=UPI003A8CCAC2